MTNSKRRRESGALLGIVMILMVVLIAASAFALWTLRADTGAAGRDRLGRQLADCAERGLAAGKVYFSTVATPPWTAQLQTDVCSVTGNTLPCPPFATGAGAGTALTGYPTSAPYTATVTYGAIALTYTFGIYNNPEIPANKWADGDRTAIVYSRCVDPTSNQVRSVQAVLNVPVPQAANDYVGQAGHGFRNQGNGN